MKRPTKPLSILITDDIEDNRQWIADIFHEVVPDALIQQAADGYEAIDAVTNKIKADEKSFDVIIMDFKMPGLNGEKTTEAIRKLEKNIQNTDKSIIITWSTAKTSAYPLADDWLPKLTTKQEVATMLTHFNLI